MRLRKLINNKIMAALAVIFTAFASTSAFAQAAAAIENPVDMWEVHKSFLCIVILVGMFVYCHSR